MNARANFGPCAKRMQFGSDLHVTLVALPPRKATSTAKVVEATGIDAKRAHAYLQVHVKRGNVQRHVASAQPRRIAWALTPRGRAMLARTAP